MGRVQYPRRAMYEVESLLNASLEPDNSRADFIVQSFFQAPFRPLWANGLAEVSLVLGGVPEVSQRRTSSRQSNERRFLRSFGRSS